MLSRLFVFLGGVLGALGVALGAIGAHALESQLTSDQLETYHTAVLYQMVHAMGMILVGLLHLHRPLRRFVVSGVAMLIGVLFFSGFLYAWLVTGWKIFVYPVPIGGTSFIIGWLFLAAGAWSLHSSQSESRSEAV
jgi:uncharacterized membrane protein YgdD (TMEM256/DUF423 family)